MDLRLILVLILYLVFAPKAAFSAATNPTSSTPAEGATLVGRESDLVLNFGVTACYFPMGQMLLKKTNDAAYSYELLGGSANSTTVTVSIPITLDPNTDYYIDVGMGKFSTCDFNFANKSDAFQIYFSTGACTTSGTCSCYNSPSCLGPCFGTDDIDHLSPPDNAHFMQSYEGLAIVFGTAVTMGVGNIYIRLYTNDSIVETIDVAGNQVRGWGTNTLTIDPSINLANNTHYYVNFDIEGWSLPVDKDKWDFWTKATPNSFAGSGL